MVRSRQVPLGTGRLRFFWGVGTVSGRSYTNFFFAGSGPDSVDWRNSFSVIQALACVIHIGYQGDFEQSYRGGMVVRIKLKKVVDMEVQNRVIYN